MKSQVSKFQNLTLSSNEQVNVKGGGLPIGFLNLAGTPEPVENGIYYPCGLPVVSQP
ncbi:MAG: hypothetical protein AAFZ15_22845 [Bacteroidota bacterium]